MTKHIDKLRAEHPELGSALFDLMESREDVQRELDTLRDGIAFLIGRYGAEGAVPVAELDALLNPTESEN
jgi:hypothetical protein